jgi:hypothetical protein
VNAFSVNLVTRGYTNNVIDNAFNNAMQYTQSNLLIGENENNIVCIDSNAVY